MKTLRFVMYLFYRYYSKGGTKHVPYFSALCAVVLLIYIHVYQVLTILKMAGEILPFKKDDPKGVLYWKMAIFLLPVFLIVAFLVKPGDLKNLQYEEKKIKRGGIYLTIYYVLNVILLFVLMFAFPQSYR